MSTQQPSPSSPDPAASEPTSSPDDSPREKPSRSTGKATAKHDDPLRGSRTSGIWVAVIVLIIVLILLAVFILQNTQQAEISYFGWTGSAPLSATVLIAAAAGAMLVAAAGALRIMQLRRRVKKDRKAH